MKQNRDLEVLYLFDAISTIETHLAPEIATFKNETTDSRDSLFCVMLIGLLMFMFNS